MSRKSVIHKLLEIKNISSLTENKKKAIHKAIADVNQRIADDCKVKKVPLLVFVNHMDYPHECKTSTVEMYVCPACETEIREVKYNGILNNPFPKYCSECGKALKAPNK